MKELHPRVLVHPDLEIELGWNKKGEEVFTGRSRKYEPYNATGSSIMECFFKFNIQLAEQKLLAALMK